MLEVAVYTKQSENFCSNVHTKCKNGKVIGKFQATGFIPKFVEELERKGYKIPRGIFQNS